ncbi:MAG: PAS domain S-box protein [Anaerolineae bacterium]|nr:PAS domain S-box protein [Anaerolineae bacterium]
MNTVHATPVVLIADDNADRRRLLRAALEAKQLAAVEAADAQACLKSCEAENPELLLLSSGMPGAVDLWTTLKTQLRFQHLHSLVILTTNDVPTLTAFCEADDCVLDSLPIPLMAQRAYALIRQYKLEQGVEFQRAILSQMADAVVAVDNDSRVIYWNPEAERVYGIPASEILGKPLQDAYQIEGFTPDRREVVVNSAAQNMWREEGVHVKRNGERIPVEVTVRSLRGEAGIRRGHITVIRDISERRKIEAALREQRELSEALRDTISALARTLDPRAVMRLILEHLGRVVPNKMANIMLLEGEQAHIAYSRGYPEEVQAQFESSVIPVYQVTTFQQMLADGNSCLISDTSLDPRWSEMNNWQWVKSYLGTPIRAYDHVVGFLNIDSDEPNTFTPLHAERLRVFADQAAIAIENAQLYDAIYRDAVEMRILHKATAFLYTTNLIGSDNLTELCEQIVRVVVSEFGKLDCGVILIGDDGETLTRVARTGAFHVNAVQTLYVSGPGLVPAAVREQQTIYAADVNSDPRYFSSNEGTASELVIPLRTSQGIIGVLDLQSAEFSAFDDHDIRLLEVFGERAATAIENARLYNQIRRYADELEERVQERTGELNRVKERVEAILNHSSDAILLVKPNGAIQQGNRAFDMMFGYTDDQAFGETLTVLAASAYQDAMMRALERLLAKGNPERLEIVATRLNGLTFDADVTLSPVISAPGQITSIVCSLRDITMRKRLEQELRESLQKERELNELKSRFIARASHEFRTPLAVILTSSDLLKTYGARMTEEQREEKLSRLQKEVRTIASMLDDLLTISKGEELKEFSPELLDLQSFARDVVHEVSEGVGVQHHLKIDCQGNCTSVYADRKLMRRIITNLLSNAVKYSPVGSQIEVTISCDSSRVVMEVEDHGIGIPPEDHARLFEAFHRAKNVDHISGTGLGLAIVKQAVELHGGMVSFTSQVGKGTVFTVVLPNLAVKEKLP